MKLLLSGGGDPSITKDLDELFIKKLGKKGRILYIPIAKRTRPFTQCNSWFENLLSDLGFQGELEMWTELEDKSIEDLEKFDGIYIGGGNTYFLLAELKRTGFDKVLKEYIVDSKGLVYGNSAGAIIMGKDISISYYAGDENFIELEDMKGLNLLEGKDVLPHFQNNFEGEKNNSTIALPEGSGYLIEEGEVEHINEVYIL